MSDDDECCMCSDEKCSDVDDDCLVDLCEDHFAEVKRKRRRKNRIFDEENEKLSTATREAAAETRRFLDEDAKTEVDAFVDAVAALKRARDALLPKLEAADKATTTRFEAACDVFGFPEFLRKRVFLTKAAEIVAKTAETERVEDAGSDRIWFGIGLRTETWIELRGEETWEALRKWVGLDA